MLLLSVADEVSVEILKIGDIVPCGGYNSGVISVVVLLCLKKYATLLGIRSYVQGDVLMHNDSKIKVEPQAMPLTSRVAPLSKA